VREAAIPEFFPVKNNDRDFFRAISKGKVFDVPIAREEKCGAFPAKAHTVRKGRSPGPGHVYILFNAILQRPGLSTEES